MSFWVWLSQAICSVVGLMGHTEALFLFLRNLHPILHSGYANLHSNRNAVGFPFCHTLSSIYCLYFFFFLMMAFLIDVKWYLIVGLICISLIMNDVEHLFCVNWPSVCLLWRTGRSGLLPIFWLGCLFFWYWATGAAYVFWRLILCQLLCLQLISPIMTVIFSSCL